ncbi:hypothetical protein FKM82_010425 [Ascaphus truei]
MANPPFTAFSEMLLLFRKILTEKSEFYKYAFITSHIVVVSNSLLNWKQVCKIILGHFKEWFYSPRNYCCICSWVSEALSWKAV